MRVENVGTWLPLATAACEHGREFGHNLHAGIALHLDDNSACRQTALGHGVDEELAGRDALSAAVQGLLGDALSRIEASLLASD